MFFPCIYKDEGGKGREVKRVSNEDRIQRQIKALSKGRGEENLPRLTILLHPAFRQPTSRIWHSTFL